MLRIVEDLAFADDLAARADRASENVHLGAVRRADDGVLGAGDGSVRAMRAQERP